VRNTATAFATIAKYRDLDLEFETPAANRPRFRVLMKSPDSYRAHRAEARVASVAEEALKKSEELFRLFMHHLPGSAWIKDTRGRYIYANHDAERLWDKSLDELIGRTDEEIFPTATADQFRENDRLVISTRRSLQTVETSPRDDGLHYSLVSKFPIFDAAGVPVFVGGIAVDITERKRAERALEIALLEVQQLKNRLQGENVYLQEEIKTEQNFEAIIGQSPPLKRALQSIERIAPTDVTVLIHGETGTGKELIARAIHDLSPRRERPLIKINCGAMAPGLIESEIFGHERGAFTGALQRRLGRFELADKGTIFLDEVSELPLDGQVKLLHVLQDGEFQRVGNSRSTRVDVRVIAATNRDLQQAVRAGSFRSDLYYRLNIFPLEVPPLRDRKADIPLLVDFFLAKFAKKLGRGFQRLSPEVIKRLSSYPWPGNIRELQNVVERGAVISRGPVIQIDESILAGAAGLEPSPSEKLGDIERAHILRVLAQTGGKVHGTEGAASILGVHPSTLRSRMEKLGIKSQRR
jgi:PAS domain S-box-containing protein